MKRPEQELQIQVAAFMDRIPGLLFWHTPNGGGRSKVEASILKAMGVKPGVPDLIVLLPNGKVGFIELKAGKGVASPAQRQMMGELRARGCPCVEARSLEQVAETLNGWLSPFGYRVPRVTTPRAEAA